MRSQSPASGADRARADSLRTVRSLMLFRVALATLILAGMVAVGLSAGGELAGPFARFGFAVIAATYVVSLAYGVGFTRVRDPVRFAYAQIAVDLSLTTLVVHATGLRLRDELLDVRPQHLGLRLGRRDRLGRDEVRGQVGEHRSVVSR